MEYQLIEKDECGYCGGSGRCYPCDGRGHTGYQDDEPCDECDTTGTCQECIGGTEMWLVFQPGIPYTGKGALLPDGKAGSMLRHIEAVRYQDSGELPDWFEPYHGLR